MQNGLLTQIVRVKLGEEIEEAHMRNRALIAYWAYANGKGKAENGKDVIEMVKREGKTYICINDYVALRNLFGQLLAEIQRIKSTGDFDAARNLVETYGRRLIRGLPLSQQRVAEIQLRICRLRDRLITARNGQN